MSTVRVEKSHYPDISITGRMGTGKTYLSDWLINNAGYQKLSFAAPLKDIEQYLQWHSPLRALIYMLRKYGNVPFRKWWTLFLILGTCRNIEIEEPKPRRRLQYLGNEIRNEIDLFYWVRLAVNQYRTLKAEDEYVHFVFEDARYPNEIAHLKAIGFHTVKLETATPVLLERLKRLYGITDKDDPRRHAASEESCDSPRNRFDYLIVNNDDDNAIECFRDIIVNYIMVADWMERVLTEKPEVKDGTNTGS